jgi:hypothetical protein
LSEQPSKLSVEIFSPHPPANALRIPRFRAQRGGRQKRRIPKKISSIPLGQYGSLNRRFTFGARFAQRVG